MWPDIDVTVEDCIAEGDKMMVRNIWRITDQNTTKKIEFHGFVLWCFADRKIVERWATITGACRGIIAVLDLISGNSCPNPVPRIFSLTFKWIIFLKLKKNLLSFQVQ
jgi:hypothetical protein